MLLESKKNLSGQGNSKLVILTSGHREFRQYAEYAEGGDTASTSHTQKSPCAEREKYNIDRPKRVLRSPAGPRRLGTATRMSASLFRRLSALFGSTPDQDPKAAKFAVLTPGHAGFPKRVKQSEGSDTTPHPKRPCFAVCALVCDLFPKAECVPTFARESERGPFVPEVLKIVWTMCWKRWYDCVSCAFHGFFEDERKSRIKGWRLNRRLAQSLLPAVRAVYEGFQGSRLWRLLGGLLEQMASWFP